MRLRTIAGSNSSELWVFNFLGTSNSAMQSVLLSCRLRQTLPTLLERKIAPCLQSLLLAHSGRTVSDSGCPLSEENRTIDGRLNPTQNRLHAVKAIHAGRLASNTDGAGRYRRQWRIA